MSLTGKPEEITDSDAIAGILSGDTALYEVIIRRYNPYLYKTGRAYGFNHQDTEDLMQETYISAFLSLGKFENRSSFKTWITRIMLNRCFQKMKKSRYQKEMPTELKDDENHRQMFANSPRIADREVLIRELNHILEKALEEIPTEYRIIFSLRELNGFSVAETSEALAISESNVKVRLSRAKKMLRGRIEQMYSPAGVYEFDLIYCDKMVERVMTAIRGNFSINRK
ncbi:MAG: sigma-70 family RNA polymerase sigma factor [Pyrinomonadaceae bacterium]